MIEKILTLIQDNSGKFDFKLLSNYMELQKASELEELSDSLEKLQEDFQIAIGKKGLYFISEDLNIFKGRISINKKGFGFVDLEDDSIFIPSSKLSSAMDKDDVVVLKTSLSGERNEGEIIKVIKRNTLVVVGSFVGFTKFRFELDDKALDKNVSVINVEDFKIVDGIKAICKIVDYNSPMKLEIERLIGHKNDPGIDILSILIEKGVKLKFDDAVQRQLRGIDDHVTDVQKLNRTDLTNRMCITIDGDDAKDLDDAISIELCEQGYKLGVHIADVSFYVKENSPIDVEALTRGTSIYMVDRVVPMLPQFLSNGVCSLNPKVDRLTITCEMIIDKNGDVISHQIFPSFIKTVERMTYNNVNKILEGESVLVRKYHRIYEMIHLMYECSLLIRNKRHDNGAIDFDREEAKIIVNDLGKVVDIKLRERFEAERIIEDFMVCANETVAAHMKWMQLPSLYRVHEKPVLKKMKEFSQISEIMGYKFKGSLDNIRPKDMQRCLESFSDDQNYPVISSLALRCMSKARYDSKCLGHFGLASEEYTHFTSPIRRYPDLVVHRMLHKYYFKNNYNPDMQMEDDLNMENIGKLTSESEKLATDVERTVQDMKKCEYMEDYVGNVFDGVITSITKFGMFIQLSNLVEGLVHITNLKDDYYNFYPMNYTLKGERTGKIYKLGQSVKIRVLSASKEKREIDFMILAPKKKNNSARRWR